MKSYGRAPSFLALTGFEQTRSVVAAIAGDHEAAARVELVLPRRGVCGGSGLFEEAPAAGGGCCGPSVAAAPELLTIGRARSAGRAHERHTNRGRRATIRMTSWLRSSGYTEDDLDQ